MKIEKLATGATIDEAIANAVKELAAPAGADVHTEIVAYPQKKILGLFGGSPAKAKAFYELPDEPVKTEPAKKTAPKAEKKQPAPQKAAPVKTEEKPAEPKKAAEVIKTAINTQESESLKAAAAYIKEILSGMGVGEVSIEAFRTQEGEVIFELDCGDDYGIVIGRRGETLDSIQYLTRLVANKTKKDGEYSRISINVGNYREKRNNALRELAKKNSEKVLKYGRNVTFEPMNPYERRIIHTAVQEIEGVSSHSVGADSGRRVVITLAEGVKPTHPSKGGYNRGRGGKGGYNRGGRGRSNSAQTEAPSRAPRTDAGAEKVSLYGKIN
ncbi:MAG: KH domain-containing protein [Clostridia bacterium]|nr:KH domain-containing protein [Clostridia bacterium]